MRLRGTYVLLAVIGPMFLPYASDVIDLSELDRFSRRLVDEAGYFVLVSLFLVLGLTVARPRLGRLFGRAPTIADVWPAIQLTVFLALLATAITFAVFFPLSLWAPDFVRGWLLGGPAAVSLDDGRVPLAPNAAAFVLMALAMPLLEEVAFRGLLFTRWARKWGLWPGAIASSLVFGLLHPDLVAATTFGIAMCILYHYSRSLWLPVLVHVLNNGLLWFYEFGRALRAGKVERMALADFQSAWWLAALAALLAGWWSVRYLRRRRLRLLPPLPYDAN